VFAFAAVLGFVLGAVALSVAVTIAHMLIAPEGLRDGQYAFIWFIYTGPPGGVLGAATGAVIALRAAGRAAAAAKICLIVGGLMVLIAGALTALMLWYVLFGSDSWKERWVTIRAALPLCGFPLWWAAILFRKGWNA
jgi:hypothetical protein